MRPNKMISLVLASRNAKIPHYVCSAVVLQSVALTALAADSIDSNTKEQILQLCGPSGSISDSGSARAGQVAGSNEKSDVRVLVGEFCKLVSVGNQAETSAIHRSAAVAIENLLDASQRERANLILNVADSLADADKASVDDLRFELAKARLFGFQDRLEESLAIRERIRMDLKIKLGEASHESIYNELFISNLLFSRGRVEEGISTLRKISPNARNSIEPFSRLSALLIRTDAASLMLEGRMDDALRMLADARSSWVTRFGPADATVVEFSRRMVEMLIRKGDFQEALRISSENLIAHPEIARARTTKEIATLLQLISLYIENNRLETARKIEEHVQNQIESNLPKISRSQYFESLSRAAVIEELRGSIERALRIRQIVVAGLREIYGPGSAEVEVETVNLANLLEKNGDEEGACRILADAQKKAIETDRLGDTVNREYLALSVDLCAARVVGATFDRKNIEALKFRVKAMSRDQAGGSDDVLGAQMLLAEVLARRGDGSEAKAILDQMVLLAEGGNAGSAVNSNTEMISEDSAKRVGKAGEPKELLAAYADLALYHARDQEFEVALRVSELARDRSLRLRFAREAWRKEGLPAVARKALQPLVERVQELDEQIASHDDIVERVRFEAERVVAAAQLAARESEISRQWHTAPRDPVLPSLPRLTASLPAGTAIVSVMHSGESWWSLVLTGSGPRFVPCGERDLGVLARAWRKGLRGEAVRVWPLADGRFVEGFERPAAAVGPRLSPREVESRIGSAWAEPVAAAAGGARRLVVVADDELVGVPLQALPLGRGRLLDRFELGYAPSVSTWLQGRNRSAAGSYAMDLLALSPGNSSAVAEPSTGQPGLAHAGREIEAIRFHFAPEKSHVLLGEDASKAKLREVSRSGELARYRFVHIAAHAWTRPDPPEASAIQLAGGAPQGAEAARNITAAEFAGLSMGSELVVFSACDTGSGRYEHGRGLLGLAHAALAAGNRSALLTLWSIADDDAAGFMEDFYGRLRGGHDAVSALALVQREWARSDDPHRSDPRTWGAFVLYGS